MVDSVVPPRFRIDVLGPLRAWRDDMPIELGPVRQQALLVALALRPNVTVSQRELLDEVWGTEPPATGVKVIPVYMYRLRKCLQLAEDAESLIGSNQHGYRFNGDDTLVDATQLELLVETATEAADSGDLAAAIAVHTQALAMFHGEPLAGLPGPFAGGERLRLAERRLTLRQRKAEWQLRLGLYDEAVGELSGLVATHPHSEPLAALLARALYGGGRKAYALAVYPRIRRRLIDDLGVEPGEELRQVHQAMLRDDTETLSAGTPPAPPAPVTSIVSAARPSRWGRNDLPVNLGELFGREQEVAVLTGPTDPAMVSVGLVDGVAGSGKTALVVHAARSQRDRYPDGCLFVDLRGNSEGRDGLTSERALRRLLRTVGAADNHIPDDVAELASAWRAATDSRRLLLVLDDASSSEQVRPLLPAGPGSKVLVTSRKRLTSLEADQRISLGPLELVEAERLLSQIVGTSRADAEPEAVRRLAQLCGQLPLALRIVGARLQHRSVWTFEHLVSRVANEGRLFEELTAEDRSVEAAFQVSYDQLPPAEQRAFRLLGLSPTVEFDKLTVAAMLGCQPDVAEDALENLVDTSLVRQLTVGRYRLHDLVAAYARRLAEAEPAEVVAAARVGVLRLYLAAARYSSDWGLEGYPTGPELADAPFDGWRDAVDWLDAASGELVDVVAHAAAIGQTDYACWLAEGLVDYYTRGGRYRECLGILTDVLPLADLASDHRMRSSLRNCLGMAYAMQNHYQPRAWLTELLEKSTVWFTDALAVAREAGDVREQARALGCLGVVARSMGQEEEALAQLNQALKLAESVDDDWIVGMAMANLGVVYHSSGRSAEALDSLAVAMGRAEKIGSPRAMGKTLCFIGTIQIDLGQFTAAAASLRRAAEFAEDVGELPLYILSVTQLGAAELGLGNLDAAIDLYQRALVAVTEQTSVELEVDIRNRLGASYLTAGNRDRAREQFKLVLDLVGDAGNPAERDRALDGLSHC